MIRQTRQEKTPRKLIPNGDKEVLKAGEVKAWQ